MEHLSNTENFGTTFKEGENLERFFEKLLSWIERRLFNKISKRVNWILDRQKDDSFEITKSGNAIETEGNWREIISGDDLLKQRYNGTSWVTVHKWYGS